jgi:hypothetical protein
MLGLKLSGHNDAPLVPDAPNRVEATRKKSEAAAPARIAGDRGRRGHWSPLRRLPGPNLTG